MIKAEQANSVRKKSRLANILAKHKEATPNKSSGNNCSLARPPSFRSNQYHPPSALGRLTTATPYEFSSRSELRFTSRSTYKKRRRRRQQNRWQRQRECGQKEEGGETGNINSPTFHQFRLPDSSLSKCLTSVQTLEGMTFRLVPRTETNFSDKSVNLFPLLLCLFVSLKVVIVVTSSNVVVGGETTARGESMQNLYRPTTSNYELDRTESEVLIRTRHGIFKGLRLREEDNSHETSKAAGREQSDTSEGRANVIGFLGIRYASAPVKRLRFMPPTAYRYAQNQVHNMQQFGPICMQRWPLDFNGNHYNEVSFQRNTENRFGLLANRINGRLKVDGSSVLSSSSMEANASYFDLQMRLMRRMMPKESYAYLSPIIKRLVAHEQSEDCLNLNIYTPTEALATAAATLVEPPSPSSSGERNGNSRTTSRDRPALFPVLVIIHGDSFDFGSGSTINGFKFVQQNRLLVVTFNYRLNILGFPPKLAGASRGNLGLMDQVAALHWIKDNIGSFGGSASNITLMGTKMGAIFVNLLMLSPFAKGLFQRAVMEDGSALSPLLSNHAIGAPPANLAHQPSIQYLRLLAKLCECPVYTQQLQQHRNGSQPASSQGAASSGQHLSNFADETKTNALTFECLRQKPVEQVMQRVPLDLLHLNQVTGELSVQSRWFNWLNENQQQRQSQQLELAKRVEGHQAAKLVQEALRQQLERVSSSQQQQSNLRESTSAGGTAEVDSLRLEEPFGAIYGPPSASVRPLFAPLLDGTIVPDEDISVAMLRQGSHFAQRDLLIGLTQPTISTSSNRLSAVPRLSTSSAAPDGSGTGGSEQPVLAQPQFELGPDHLLAARISALTESAGLSNDLAIELVNLFVRSFYRYHNQEITNSIISHYLLNAGTSAARRPSKQQFPSGATSTSNGGELHELEINKRLLEDQQRQHQLLVLDSLLEAFQDALTSVPVLKTALIHATRQLDSLAEAFVGQQFEKWRQLDNRFASFANHSTGYFDDGNKGSNKNNVAVGGNQTDLMDSFTAFAQSLFNDPSWPLELHLTTQNRTILQPKATYLFQFDSSLLVRELELSIRRLQQANKNSNLGWRSIREKLNGLLIKLRTTKPHLSFGCAFEYLGFETAEDEPLIGQLKRTICARLGSTLAGFVATGTTNANQDTLKLQLVPSISERLSRFETNCLNQQRQSEQVTSADHFSVQPASGDNINQESTISDGSGGSEEACRHELNSMTLDYLIGAEEDTQNSQENEPHLKRWSVFNLFSQKVATLPSFSRGSGSGHLQVANSISDEPKYGQTSKASFPARSSFWSNFIPALNCTRTQPIQPSSLLGSGSIHSTISLTNSSSSLLNLNLVFSCQQGASQTVLNAIESLSSYIWQQLNARLANRRLSGAEKTNTSDNQNHHSLRMTNISQSGLPEDSLEQLEQPEQPPRLNGKDASNQSEMDEQQLQAGKSAFAGIQDTRTKLAADIVLLSCGLLVSLTLVSGAIVVLRQRRNQNQRRRRKSNESLHFDEIKASKQAEITPKPMQGSISDNGDDQTGVGHSRTQLEAVPHQLVPSGAQMEQEEELTRSHVCALPSQIQLQEEQEQVAQSLIYWQQAGQQLFTNPGQVEGATGSYALCRSHSSLNMLPLQVPATNEQLEQLSWQQSTDTTQEEPILAPLMLSQQPVTSVGNNRRPGCLLNGNRQSSSRSSAETQAQNSSIGSLNSKKRVKIANEHSLATLRRPQNGSKFRQATLSNGSSQNYCPVHRPDSNSLDTSGYLLHDMQQQAQQNWDQMAAPQVTLDLLTSGRNCNDLLSSATQPTGFLVQYDGDSRSQLGELDLNYSQHHYHHHQLASNVQAYQSNSNNTGIE